MLFSLLAIATVVLAQPQTGWWVFPLPDKTQTGFTMGYVEKGRFHPMKTEGGGIWKGGGAEIRANLGELRTKPLDRPDPAAAIGWTPRIKGTYIVRVTVFPTSDIHAGNIIQSFPGTVTIGQLGVEGEKSAATVFYDVEYPELQYGPVEISPGKQVIVSLRANEPYTKYGSRTRVTIRIRRVDK